MEIPYYIFGLIYVLVLAGFAVFFLVTLYHMARFGLFDFIGKMNTLLVSSIVLSCLIITVILLSPINWFASVAPFQVTMDDILPQL
jgi:hypothetical protein